MFMEKTAGYFPSLYSLMNRDPCFMAYYNPCWVFDAFCCFQQKLVALQGATTLETICVVFCCNCCWLVSHKKWGCFFGIIHVKKPWNIENWEGFLWARSCYLKNTYFQRIFCKNKLTRKNLEHHIVVHPGKILEVPVSKRNLTIQVYVPPFCESTTTWRFSHVGHRISWRHLSFGTKQANSRRQRVKKQNLRGSFPWNWITKNTSKKGKNGGGVWGNFWVYVSRAFCLEKILYFLNFFNSIKMQEIIEIIRKIKK